MPIQQPAEACRPAAPLTASPTAVACPPSPQLEFKLKNKPLPDCNTHDFAVVFNPLFEELGELETPSLRWQAIPSAAQAIIDAV